jgi:hypothetical protein
MGETHPTFVGMNSGMQNKQIKTQNHCGGDVENDSRSLRECGIRLLISEDNCCASPSATEERTKVGAAGKRLLQVALKGFIELSIH